MRSKIILRPILNNIENYYDHLVGASNYNYDDVDDDDSNIINRK
jgi:hypothetical protein